MSVLSAALLDVIFNHKPFDVELAEALGADRVELVDMGIGRMGLKIHTSDIDYPANIVHELAELGRAAGIRYAGFMWVRS